jgi:hypothetical protein
MVGVADGDAVSDAVGATVEAGLEISVREKHSIGRRNAVAGSRKIFIRRD